LAPPIDGRAPPAPLRIAITLGTLNPRVWDDVVDVAEEVGIESVWVSDHLVAPVRTRGALHADARALMKPSTPLMDAGAYCAYLAGRTSRLLVGTYVFLLGLRHPIVSARMWATVDRLSAGRLRLGVGSGWLSSEWDVMGEPFRHRGARLDEAIDVCQRLWTEPVVSHRGAHWEFEAVGFEPKPTSADGIALLVGGESAAAKRRAARVGSGWMGMRHTPQSATSAVHEMRRALEEVGRLDPTFSMTVRGELNSAEDLERWLESGVNRLIVVPWSSSSSAVSDLRRYADEVIGPLGLATAT
jgi:probable F420-dependent oxidoreductase